MTASMTDGGGQGAIAYLLTANRDASHGVGAPLRGVRRWTDIIRSNYSARLTYLTL